MKNGIRINKVVTEVNPPYKNEVKIMFADIKNRINELELSIDSLYIQNKDNLNVIIEYEKLHEL